MRASSKIFAVGDIHGCSENLAALLSRLPMDLERDTIVFLGDYINRGPDTRGVLDLLLRVRDTYAKTVFLRGNHEQSLLEYVATCDVETLRVLRMMGVEATLASYGATARDLPGLAFMPLEHREFLYDLELTHVEGRYRFLHADADEAAIAVERGLAEGEDLEPLDGEQHAASLDRMLSSRRLMREEADTGGYVEIFGHASFETPLVMPDRICVDTGAVYGNMLTALELPAVRFHHA